MIQVLLLTAVWRNCYYLVNLTFFRKEKTLSLSDDNWLAGFATIAKSLHVGDYSMTDQTDRQ